MDIRIEPGALRGTIRAVSSKSDVHRFLIAASLADGRSDLKFTSVSTDISATIGAMRALGATIDISGDEGDYTAEITGIKSTGFCEIDALECGTTARLIMPVAAALADGFSLRGSVGLAARPFAALCETLRSGGVTCSSDTLPITVNGRLKSGTYKIRGDISSQYISGLLFALPLLDGDSRIVLTTPAVSVGYIDMTLDMLRMFGIRVMLSDDGFLIKGNQTYHPVREYVAEGDWSNSCFWLCAGAIGGDITVTGLDIHSRQRDKLILSLLADAGAMISIRSDSVSVSGQRLRPLYANGSDVPDMLPVLAATLAIADGKSVLSGGSRLKLKESNRIVTTAEMINSLGGRVNATDDGFEVDGVKTLSGGECFSANDHRIAMSAAVLACRTQNGVILHGADAVQKSYPSFFEDYKKLGGNCCVITNG